MEQKQPSNGQDIPNPVERLETALAHLGFALEQKEKQAQQQQRESKARLIALSERIERLEERLNALLNETTTKEG